MRVLLVEDDTSVADGVVDGLRAAAIETHHVGSGAEALAALADGPVDLILLDLGLPDMDGTEVCRAIRRTSSTPVIVISARDDEIDRVVALEIGADDYLVKPFGMRELVARIKAVLRRTATAETEAEPTTTLRVGSLEIDERSRRVVLDGVELGLTPKEFDLLAYFAREPGAALRRSEILHAVWQTTWYGTTKTLDAHVASLRRKLGDPAWIVSVRGVGFRFAAPS